MELKIKLTCVQIINKETVIVDFLKGVVTKPVVPEIIEEYSKSFGKNGKMVRLLNLPLDSTINNGKIKVKEEWIPKLQPYFKNKINTKKYRCHIEFEYRKYW